MIELDDLNESLEEDDGSEKGTASDSDKNLLLDKSERKKSKPTKFQKSKSLSSFFDLRKQVSARFPLKTRYRSLRRHLDPLSSNHNKDDVRRNYIYLIIGFILMCLVLLSIILIGVFGQNNRFFAGWIASWIFVSCAFCFCSRKPKGIHLCNGIAVALIFGLGAMVSFSYVHDVKNRERYGSVDVAVPQLPKPPIDNAIIYFLNGVVAVDFVGETYRKVDPDCASDSFLADLLEKCELLYYCVSPIVLNDTKVNASSIAYWAGCRLTKAGQDCHSIFFRDADCLPKWKRPLNSGFIFDHQLTSIFLEAVQSCSNQNHLSIPDSIIVVEWVSDPIKSSYTLWAFGWIAAFGAPLIYFIYSVLFTFFWRKARREKEELYKKGWRTSFDA